jgi:hypothetical protein
MQPQGVLPKLSIYSNESAINVMALFYISIVGFCFFKISETFRRFPTFMLENYWHAAHRSLGVRLNIPVEFYGALYVNAFRVVK